MKTILLTAVAAAFFAVATFGIVTSSNADPEQIDSAMAAPSEHRPPRLDIRIKTDDYLVPAHVCADADAERYEDCVPWSHVRENALLVRPVAD